MKNAPITIKVTVAILVSVVVIYSILELSNHFQVQSAKSWCEEYAEIMLEHPEKNKGGLDEHSAISKRIGWQPNLFWGAYGFSARVDNGEALVNFSSDLGSYSFSSHSGWEKTGSGMPMMVAVDG